MRTYLENTIRQALGSLDQTAPVGSAHIEVCLHRVSDALRTLEATDDHIVGFVEAVFDRIDRGALDEGRVTRAMLEVALEAALFANHALRPLVFHAPAELSAIPSVRPEARPSDDASRRWCLKELHNRTHRRAQRFRHLSVERRPARPLNLARARQFTPAERATATDRRTATLEPGEINRLIASLDSGDNDDRSGGDLALR